MDYLIFLIKSYKTFWFVIEKNSIQWNKYALNLTLNRQNDDAFRTFFSNVKKNLYFS